MLRFTKETDLERIKRIENSIINNYVEDDEAQELLISESDLAFLVEKAKEQIIFETESENKQITPNDSRISQIEPSMYKNTDGNQIF